MSLRSVGAIAILAWGSAAECLGDPVTTAIAVLDFDANNAPASEAAIITEFVRNELVASGRYSVVERGNMHRILAEQALQQTGCTTQECAVKLGRILNASRVIVGTYSILGENRFLTARMVDVESGKVMSSATYKAFDPGSVDVAAKELINQLVAPVRGGLSDGGVDASVVLGGGGVTFGLHAGVGGTLAGVLAEIATLNAGLIGGLGLNAGDPRWDVGVNVYLRSHPGSSWYIGGRYGTISRMVEYSSSLVTPIVTTRNGFYGLLGYRWLGDGVWRVGFTLGLGAGYMPEIETQHPGGGSRSTAAGQWFPAGDILLSLYLN